MSWPYSKKMLAGKASFIILITFIVTYKFRTFSLFSGIGYIDPWVNVGYGDVFPNSAFQWHYYKESRIFTILTHSIFSSLDSRQLELIYALIVCITTLLCAYFFFIVSNNTFFSIAIAVIICQSPLLWGDSAGGIDYYNTLGNFVILVFLILTFSFLKELPFEIPKPQNIFVWSLLASIIIQEIPSGIVIIFCVTSSVLLSLLLQIKLGAPFNAIKKRKFRLGMVVCLGASTPTLIQVILYPLLGESYKKALTGLFFLFQSLTDSSIQRPWWRPLSLSEFLTFPHLRFLLFLLFINGTLTLLLANQIFVEKKISAIQFFSANFAYSITCVLLVFSQISGKSVVLSLQYMSVPLILVGLVFAITSILHTIQLARRSLFATIFLLLFSALIMFYVQTTWLQNVVFVSLVVFFVASFALKLSFSPKANPSLILVIAPLLVLSLGPNYIADLKNRDGFVLCEQERAQFRSDLLYVSTLLDKKSPIRGSTLLSSSPSLLSQNINSVCKSSQELTIGDGLISLSALGFPGVAILGPIIEKSISDETYPYSQLANPLGRTTQMDRCYFFLDRSNSDGNIDFELFSQPITIDLYCPN